jgi:hypothetical protein
MQKLALRKTQGAALLLAAVLASLVAPAYAVDPTTLAELTSSVSFSTVTTAMFAIAGTMIGVYVAWRGIKFVLRAVKGL